MVQEIKLQNNKALGFKIDGEVKTEEIESLSKELEAKVERHGTVNLYMEIEEFSGYQDMNAFWEDLSTTASNFEKFDKVALVPHHKIYDSLGKVADAVLEADIKIFRTEHREEAKEWVSSPI